MYNSIQNISTHFLFVLLTTLGDKRSPPYLISCGGFPATVGKLIDLLHLLVAVMGIRLGGQESNVICKVQVCQLLHLTHGRPLSFR